MTSQPAPSPEEAPEWPSVSVVMVVRDEERHLREAVTRVLEQHYPGELEVVIALGPSKDRTAEVAAALVADDVRVRTIDNPTGRTPHGLNAAVGASRGEVVVRVDGHAILPPRYIETAVRTLQRTGADNVGGIMDARGVTTFEQAVACAMRSPLGVGQSSFHVGGAEGEADTVYLGVFRRSALERVGGYDEHFQRAQDWEMNHRIRTTGGRVWFTPDLRVVYRPRSSVRGLAEQYFNYGRWRRVVARRHQGTINLRYLAPPLTLAACVVGLAASPVVPWALVLPGGYVVGVVAGAAVVGRELSWRAKPLLPLVLATMHLSWGAGFLTSPRRLAVQAGRAEAATRASSATNRPASPRQS